MIRDHQQILAAHTTAQQIMREQRRYSRRRLSIGITMNPICDCGVLEVLTVFPSVRTSLSPPNLMCLVTFTTNTDDMMMSSELYMCKFWMIERGCAAQNGLAGVSCAPLC